MADAHTGWTLEGDHEWSDCHVSFDGSGYHYTIYEPGRALPVAFVIGKGDDHRGEDANESRRDALIMAAAPELLATLTEARITLAMLKRNVTTEIVNHDGLFRWEGVPEAIQARIDDCDRAIAKATGSTDEVGA